MDAKLRKAAILIDSLDSPSANSLLERFSADESAQILAARVHLQDVRESERASVIREFYAENSSESTESDGDHGESSLALKLLPSETPDEIAYAIADDAPPSPTKSFEFLADADVRILARHLADEPSRSVALVLCHLAPDRAAEILQQLPENKQIDVVFHMSVIDDLSPAAVSDVEKSLRKVLLRNETSPGFAAILSMMAAVDTPSRVELIEQLHSHHRDLASQLADSIDARTPVDVSARGELDVVVQGESDAEDYDFEDLVNVDRQSLATLIQEAEPQEVLLALTGASSWMVTRLLSLLPARDEKKLRLKMDRCGPLTLPDIAVAQKKLVQLAVRLAAEGKITRPPRRPFTSVA